MACNNPPGPATIALSPAEPLTTDDLTVVFLSESAASRVAYRALDPAVVGGYTKGLRLARTVP